MLNDLVAGNAKAYKYPWFVDLLDGVDVTAPDVVNFNFYAEAFAAWLKQIETLNGREVSLINPALFAANPARLVDKKLFASLDGNKTKLTVHEVWYRLTEPFKYDSTVSGFGKFLRRLYDIYFLHILPWIGGLVSGEKAAYRYLPASVHNFPAPEAFSKMLSEAGFTSVRYRTLSLGLCRLYVGEN